MRYELKHDKLAAQIFLRASAAAKARRRAEEVYAFYTEIASKRLLTAEELDYLGPFATVLEAPEELGLVMEKSREKIREMLDAELTKARAQEAKEKQLREKAETALAQLEQTLEEIRERNLLTFCEFADLGAHLVYTLDHAEALQKLRTAAGVKVDADAKRSALSPPLSELLFFFAEGGRRPELAREAAALLFGLGQAETLSGMLDRCIREEWSLRAQFAPLLTALPGYQQLSARYYPVLVDVPMGSDGVFEMGTHPSEWGHRPDETLHKVRLEPYQMAVTPVTFYQFALFNEATGFRWSSSRTPYWGRNGNHPIVNVNWYDAAEYANWLNVQQGLLPCYNLNKEKWSDPDNESQYDILKWKVTWNPAIRCYRLPTEAEWELAARGGVGAPRYIFSGGGDLEDLGWFMENSGDEQLSGGWDLYRILDNNGQTHPVGGKKANGIGLYDMSGNIFEWCWDWFGPDFYKEFANQGMANPVGPGKGRYRVLRGGCWLYTAEDCRSASRDRRYPADRSNNVGFRLVFVP